MFYGLCISFFILMVFVLAALTVQAIIDSVTIILVLFYLALALFFLFLAILFAYTLVKDIIPQKKEAERSMSLTDSFCNYAGSGGYSCIRVDFSRNMVYSAVCYNPDGSSSIFSFNRYGYNGVSKDEAMRMLRDLDYRLDGYLVVGQKEIGGYDSSVSVTPGIMPGGGEGYYVNIGNYDTTTIPTYACLYLGETARQKRLENKKARR